MKTEIKNGKIESTHLGFEGHGIFSSMITIETDDGHQGFGGYSLGGKSGMEFIETTLKTLEVEKWEDLKGKLIRVKREDRRMVAIGHYLKDNWLNIEEFFKERENKDEQ